MDTLLAYDLGTSGLKCTLFDLNGKALSVGYKTYQTAYPAENRHEQRPQDWLNAMIAATHEALEKTLCASVCAIGVSGHSLGALPVAADGTLLCESVPIWSDARATREADDFFKKIDYRGWYEATGNGFPREIYAVFKILWYRDAMPALYRRTDKFIGTKDYINAFLTGKLATDCSYASGSGLYSLRDGSYVREYITAAGIAAEKLPEIIPSAAIVGRVTQTAAKLLGVRSGIPVAAGGVDNACMSLGAGCFEAGDVYASLGSSAWITASAGTPVTDFRNRIYTFAHCVPGQFLPGAGIFSSGASLAWAADTLFCQYTGEERFNLLSDLAAQAPAGANGLLFNPCLAGGSAFDKSPHIRGGLFGLQLRHTRSDVARCVFEGIAMHLRLASEALESSVKLGNRMLLVGGGAKGAFNRQVYADVFNKQVEVTEIRQDAASLGAAALAAISCGAWRDYQPVRTAHGAIERCLPDPANVKRYQDNMPVYRQLCDACSDLADAAVK